MGGVLRSNLHFTGQSLKFLQDWLGWQELTELDQIDNLTIMHSLGFYISITKQKEQKKIDRKKKTLKNKTIYQKSTNSILQIINIPIPKYPKQRRRHVFHYDQNTIMDLLEFLTPHSFLFLAHQHPVFTRRRFNIKEPACFQTNRTLHDHNCKNERVCIQKWDKNKNLFYLITGLFLL